MKAKYQFRSFFFHIYKLIYRLFYLIFIGRNKPFNPYKSYFTILRIFKHNFTFKKGLLKFYFDPVHTGIGWQLYLEGKFEEEELNLCNSIIMKDDVIADIGANIGFHTIHFATAAVNGKVLAFEPSRFTLSYLLKNSLGYPNIIINCCALSDENGVVPFFESENDALSGLKDTERAPVRQGTQVLVQTFDFVFESTGIGRLDFVKIDVEGFELNVLKGMEASIQKYRPVIFCEVYQGTNSNLFPDATIQHLMDRGYSAFVQDGMKLVTYTRHSDVLHNYLFIPKEKNLIFDRLKTFGL